MNEFKLVKRFHQKFDLEYNGPPRFLPEDILTFRIKFLQEELDEYKEAVAEGNLSKALDALIDLEYVAKGTAYLHGFRKYRKGFKRVHRANMKKVRATREEESMRGSTFDVIKPIGWKAPDLSDLVK